MLIRIQSLGLATTLTLLVVGCAVPTEHTRQPEQVYLTADTVPVDVETYPSTSYDGHRVYLWNEHWYYRLGAGWVYYRDEPSPLRQHRETLHRPPPPHERDRPPSHPDDLHGDEPGRTSE